MLSVPLLGHQYSVNIALLVGSSLFALCCIVHIIMSQNIVLFMALLQISSPIQIFKSSNLQIFDIRFMWYMFLVCDLF